MTERWLPVVGYEGKYEVSDQGSVRSVDRYVDGGRGGRRRWLTGRILRPYTGGRYMTVQIGHGNTKSVHHLVIEAFLGPRPDGMDACHNNGQSHDNRLENLRWDTPINNAADRRAHGTQRNQNAGKTHCIHGHEFTPENTYRSTGARKCRTCTIARARAAENAAKISPLTA
jgi:hypothetical protein